MYVCMYVSVACNWVVEDADGSHHLAHQPRLAGAEVGRVAHNDGSLRYLITPKQPYIQYIHNLKIHSLTT